MSVEVTLYIRTVIDPRAAASYRYTTGESFTLDEAPAVGDIVSYGANTWEVIARQWLIADPNSPAARRGEPSMLDLVVVAADGLFTDEAELTSDDSDDQGGE